MNTVLIHGRGIAAITCARQLVASGAAVTLCGPLRRRSLVVLLGGPTLDLLSEVFADPGLRHMGHAIAGRVIRWDTDVPNRLHAPARSVRLDELVVRLESSLHGVSIREAAPTSPSVRWQVDATGRGSLVARRLAGVSPTRFGRRCVVAATLDIAAGGDEAIMERVDRGWLFLFPASEQQVVAQLMCPRPPTDLTAGVQAALRQATLVSERIQSAPIVGVASVPAAPHILPTVGSDRWLAVGEAAIAVDPICGDGIGMAVRSAILAAAVMQSTAPADLHANLDHYHMRHQQVFAAHLQHVERYYEPLRDDMEWAAELDSTRRFLRSGTAQRHIEGGALRRRLQDGKLVPRFARTP